MSFSCLAPLARTSSIKRKWYKKHRWPYLATNFSGNVLNFSLFGLMLPVGLLYIGTLLCWGVFLEPLVSPGLLAEGNLDFPKAFTASNEVIMSFLSFSQFICWITLLIYNHRIILVFLKWNLLHHSGWFFFNVPVFSLHVFSRILSSIFRTDISL